MNLVALIPMRGGSKSIPLKNIKPIAGKPLCYWSIQSALQSGIFSEVYVSTDSLLIRETVEKLFGEKVKVVDRAPELATDEASTESVMLDFAKTHSFDAISLIQATSPLVKATDFQTAFKKFNSEGLDSLLTGCLLKRFFWSIDGHALNYNPAKRPRRQEFNGTIIENGAFYFTKREVLLKNQNRLGGKIGIHQMSEDTLIEIDEISDWALVEKELMKANALRISYEEISAIVIDVDGTLTDGGMYYSGQGEELKKFNTRDAQGIAIVRNQGRKVCIATAEDSPSVHARFKKVKVDNYLFGLKNKLPSILEWLGKENIPRENVLYIGDDLGDLECFKYFSHTACPKDAVPAIRSLATFISARKGGEGAVRDIFDTFFAGRESE